MALPVLDGNQSATTLSSVVTGGEHIVAHTVVSLGSTAISDITSAISGSVVSISNFPATQPISGTVTANAVGFDSFNGIARSIPVAPCIEGIGQNDLAVSVIIASETGSVNTFNPLPISGTVTANLSSPYYDSGNAVTLQRVLISRDSGDGSGDTDIIGKEVNGNIISLPISGTVTANVAGQYFDGASGDTAQLVNPVYYDGEIFRVSPSRPLPVALANGYNFGASVTIGSFATSVTARLINPAGTAVTYAEVGTAGNPSIDVLSVQGVSGGTNLPIAGSVTISGVPNGALTTRFGSVVTANTALLTAAVTNSERRYLLIQNVTTSSNVITVGVGFTPTTTQGIQLTAGAGITFESSYIPTGAVYILSSVTASTFTILEA